MHPVVLDYFGDPLVLDSQLDDNGRIFMLFSKRVNDLELGVAGFVFSGDFFTGSQCAASNRREIFYGRVPTVAGSGYASGTPGYWAWSMRSTVIHEVKHITSYAHKFAVAAGGAPNYEAQWLEEGSARLAEELYIRRLMGYGQGDNTQYEQSIYCEVRVGVNWPDCDPFPYVMGRHFHAINSYYKATELLSPIGKANDEDWTYYGSGWLLLRWALDHSATTEAAFITALVDEPDLAGVQNLAARTGRSFRDMLADFSLAMAADDHPDGMTPARPELTFPSWDTRDIFDGLFQDYGDDDSAFAANYESPWPLTPRVLAAGDFAVEVPALAGGSASIFQLEETTGPQLLELLSATGGTAPANLGLAIVRVN
jgi:hypothetical protein